MTGTTTEKIGTSLCTNPTKQQSPIMLPAPANANETSVSTDLKFYLEHQDVILQNRDTILYWIMILVFVCYL